MAMYTLDRVAPVAPTITGSPTSPDRLTTPQWTFVVEDAIGGPVLDRRRRPGCPARRPSAPTCRAPPTASHTFAVRSVDAAGNVGATTTGAFVLDRTPPGAPVVTSGPAARQRRRHADLDVRRRRRRRGVVPRRRRAVGTVRRLVHRRPHGRRRRHPLPRGARRRRRRQRGPRPRSPPSSSIAWRPRPPPSPRSRCRPATTRAPSGRSPTSPARPRGARSTAPPPPCATAPSRPTLDADGVHELVVVVVGCRRQHERRGHEHLRARHGRARRARCSPRPAPPTATCTRSGASRWSPGAVAECSFDGGEAGGLRHRLHRRPRRPRGPPPASPSSPATRPGTSRSWSPAPTSSTRSHRRPP